MKPKQSRPWDKFRGTPIAPASFVVMRKGSQYRMREIFLAALLLLGMGTTSMATSISPAGMSDVFRSRVLNVKPSDLGITQDNYPHHVFAIVMEAGLPEGSFTLSSIADGSTSLYFSASSGIVGAGDYQAVREASGRLLAHAQQYYGNAEQVHVFPKPRHGQVIFYFITFDGVLSYSARAVDLDNERDELSSLFFAANNVITSIRKVSEHWR